MSPHCVISPTDFIVMLLYIAKYDSFYNNAYIIKLYNDKVIVVK